MTSDSLTAHDSISSSFFELANEGIAASLNMLQDVSFCKADGEISLSSIAALSNGVSGSGQFSGASEESLADHSTPPAKLTLNATEASSVSGAAVAEALRELNRPRVEYLPGKELKSIKLADGRSFARATSESAWAAADGKVTSLAKVELTSEDSITLTDKSGIKTIIGNLRPDRFSYPSFDVQSLPVLFLKNENLVDTNRDGYIDRVELERAILSPQFKGEDAQFLAALQMKYEYIRSQKTAIFGFDRSGIGFDDVQELAEGVKRQAALKERVQGYETVVRKQFSPEKTEIFEADVTAKLASGLLNYQDRLSLKNFLEDFEKYKKFDPNPFARARVDLKSLNDGVLAQISAADSSDAYITEKIRSATVAIETGTRQLFKDEDKPLTSISAENVVQGSIGDCTFLAALSSLAAVAPDSIRQMIKTNFDGSFTVTFPGSPDEPIRVSRLTETEVLLYARSSPSGCWSQVLEKAYGQYLHNHGRVSLNARNPNTLVPSEGADGGALLQDPLKLLSHHKIALVNLENEGPDSIKKAIVMSLKEGGPITLEINLSKEDMKAQARKYGDLPNNHAYSVIGFDEKRDRVKIRNPWGQSETTSGGKARDCIDDGIFELPVSQLNQYFVRMAFSQ